MKTRKYRRAEASQPKTLTPNTKLKIGESFLAYRRVSNIETGEASDERCVATIVDIREDFSKTHKFSTHSGFETNNEDVESICEALLNDLCKEVDRNAKNEVNSGSSEEKKYLYYVHYDGLDKRLDEWIERERFIERAKPTAVSRSVLVVPPSLAGTIPESKTMTRSQRRIHEEFNHAQNSYFDMDATTAKLEEQRAEMTKVKNIDLIRFGEYSIPAWYASPYPVEFDEQRLLFICEYCLAYMKTINEYACHMLYYCDQRQPPGTEIYRSGNLAIYEVDGGVDKVDEKGVHIVGHFSKEQLSANNLACIMVLPPFQRRGYGKLLIQLSYELSFREGVIGTPEKPLSDLGKVSYRSFWWWTIMRVLDELDPGDILVSDLSRVSGLAEDDIITTLQTIHLIRYWKGDHVVHISRGLMDHCRANKIGAAPSLLLEPEHLNWRPKPCKTPNEKVSKSL